MREIAITNDVSLADVKRKILLQVSKEKNKEPTQPKYLVPDLLYTGTKFSNLEICILETASLKKPEYRMKKQSLGGMKALKISLTKYGIKAPIIVNKRSDDTLVIINGYNVNKMWRALKNETIPAVLLEVSIEQEQELHIHLNSLTQETDLAAILNHLDHLNPEDYDLISVDPKAEEDDKDHLKKELEKAEIKAKENKAQGIKRWRFTYDQITYEKLKKEMNQAKLELAKNHDADVLEYLLMNWKKLIE